MNQTPTWATLALALIWMAGSPAKGQPGDLQWRHWVNQDPMTDKRYHQASVSQQRDPYQHEQRPSLLFTCEEKSRVLAFNAFFGNIISTTRHTVEGLMRVDRNPAIPFRGETEGASSNSSTAYAIGIHPVPPDLISQMRDGFQIRVRVVETSGQWQDAEFSLAGFTRAFNKLLAGCPLMRTP